MVIDRLQRNYNMLFVGSPKKVDLIDQIFTVKCERGPFSAIHLYQNDNHPFKETRFIIWKLEFHFRSYPPLRLFENANCYCVVIESSDSRSEVGELIEHHERHRSPIKYCHRILVYYESGSGDKGSEAFGGGGVGGNGYGTTSGSSAVSSIGIQLNDLDSICQEYNFQDCLIISPSMTGDDIKFKFKKVIEKLVFYPWWKLIPPEGQEPQNNIDRDLYKKLIPPPSIRNQQQDKSSQPPPPPPPPPLSFVERESATVLFKVLLKNVYVMSLIWSQVKCIHRHFNYNTIEYFKLDFDKVCLDNYHLSILDDLLSLKRFTSASSTSPPSSSSSSTSPTTTTSTRKLINCDAVTQFLRRNKCLERFRLVSQMIPIMIFGRNNIVHTADQCCASGSIEIIQEIYHQYGVLCSLHGLHMAIIFGRLELVKYIFETISKRNYKPWLKPDEKIPNTNQFDINNNTNSASYASKFCSEPIHQEILTPNERSICLKLATNYRRYDIESYLLDEGKIVNKVIRFFKSI